MYSHAAVEPCLQETRRGVGRRSGPKMFQRTVRDLNPLSLAAVVMYSYPSVEFLFQVADEAVIRPFCAELPRRFLVASRLRTCDLASRALPWIPIEQSAMSS